MSYYQGRLFDHIHLRVSDFGRSKDFYDAVLNVLGRNDCVSHGRDWMECDELMIDEIEPGGEPSRIHLAFQAASREMVQEFHDVAIRAGGRDNGAPDIRDYHPGYYAAYVLDPDGNNIEAKFDERVRNRSAEGIEIETD